MEGDLNLKHFGNFRHFNGEEIDLDAAKLERVKYELFNKHYLEV